MASLRDNPKFVLGVFGVIILAAVVLGITQYKIPKKSVTNSNQSLTNTMASYPFSSTPDSAVTSKQVRITTAKGDIVFALDPVSAPLAAKNFVYLAQKGFYDGLTFWRVDTDPYPFVIQGGDPLGTGMGGPGYKFADDPVSKPYLTGTVAMANSGADTNGSQFFICLDDLTAKGMLAPNYSIFGQVTSGIEVVKKITVGDVMTKVTIEPAT